MIILSTLIGFLSSAMPELFKIFRDRADRSHELEILHLQMQQRAQGHFERLAEINVQADIADSAAVGERLQQSLVGIRWVDALSGTVRPILTYLFFGVYAAVKVAQFNMLVAPTLPWQEATSAAQALVTVWTPDDMALFAAIVCFWFGNRTFGKMRNG